MFLSGCVTPKYVAVTKSTFFYLASYQQKRKTPNEHAQQTRSAAPRLCLVFSVWPTATRPCSARITGGTALGALGLCAQLDRSIVLSAHTHSLCSVSTKRRTNLSSKSRTKTPTPRQCAKTSNHSRDKMLTRPSLRFPHVELLHVSVCRRRALRWNVAFRSWRIARPWGDCAGNSAWSYNAPWAPRPVPTARTA